MHLSAFTIGGGTTDIRSTDKRLRYVSKGKRHEVLTGIHQLLNVRNIVPADAVIEFNQVLIAAPTVDEHLNLFVAELRVCEDGSVRVEGAEDTVVAEVDEAVVMMFHCVHEVVDVGLVLQMSGWVPGWGKV